MHSNNKIYEAQQASKDSDLNNFETEDFNLFLILWITFFLVFLSPGRLSKSSNF